MGRPNLIGCAVFRDHGPPCHRGQETAVADRKTEKLPATPDKFTDLPFPTDSSRRRYNQELDGLPVKFLSLINIWRREIMATVAPLGGVYQAGPLSGNPVAMAAGLAQLRFLLDNPQVYGQIEQSCAYLVEGLQKAAAEAEVPLTVHQIGSLACLFFTGSPVDDYGSAKSSDTKRFARYFNAMLTRGCLLYTSMEQQFVEGFTRIAELFNQVFRKLFGGGRGLLRLAEGEGVLEAGIEIIAQPPGKKLQSMMLLSGGEKALTAIALLFAIQQLNPAPFCICLLYTSRPYPNLLRARSAV